MSRKPYPTDVSDDEWNFVAPYLTLMTPDAPQREYPLREVFNALRYMARGGEAWRMLPHDLPRIGWERENVLRFWPLAKVRQFCACHSREVG